MSDLGDQLRTLAEGVDDLADGNATLRKIVDERQAEMDHYKAELDAALARIKELEQIDVVQPTPDPTPEPSITYTPESPKANEDITITIHNADFAWIQLRPNGKSPSTINEETGGTTYTKKVKLTQAGRIRVEANPDGQGGNDTSLMIDVAPADPIITIPSTRQLVEVLPGQTGFPEIPTGNGTREVIIENKHFKGIGTAGKDGDMRGIRITGHVKSVTVRNCEFENLSGGMIIQAPDGKAIDFLHTEDVYIHDIYDAGDGDPFKTRAQGIYAQGVQHLRFINYFAENVGWKEGLDPADIFSHLNYISTDDGIDVLCEFQRCLFKDGSSHAINCGAASLDDVICVSNPIQFGVKQVVGKPTNLYSVAVDKNPVGNWAPRGKHFYEDHPEIGKYITVIDEDPFDWAKIHEAAKGDLSKVYDVALADLKAGGR